MVGGLSGGHDGSTLPPWLQESRLLPKGGCDRLDFSAIDIGSSVGLPVQAASSHPSARSTSTSLHTVAAPEQLAAVLSLADGQVHGSGAEKPPCQKGLTAGSHSGSEQSDLASAQLDGRRTPRKTGAQRKGQPCKRHNRKEAANRQRSHNEELSFRCSSLQQVLTDSEAHARGLEHILIQAPQGPAAGLGASQQDGQGTPAGGQGIHTIVAAMTPMLLLLVPDLEVATAQLLLAPGVSDMLQGNTGSIAFLLKTLVQQLLQCLIRIDQPQAHATVHCLMSAYGEMLKNVGLIQPQAMLTLMSLSGEEGQPASKQHWHNALEVVQLHREQKRQLVEAHVSLVLQNKRLASARLSLVQQLQALQTRPWDSAASVLSSSTQITQLLDQLHKSHQDGQQLVLQFVTTVLQALEPVQHARAMVSCFPCALDLLAMCSLLCQAAPHPAPAPPQPAWLPGAGENPLLNPLTSPLAPQNGPAPQGAGAMHPSLRAVGSQLGLSEPSLLPQRGVAPPPTMIAHAQHQGLHASQSPAPFTVTSSLPHSPS